MTEQFDKVRARWNPKRTDDLRPDAVPNIGRTWTWQALWIIEEGPYEGQWAWAPNATVRDAGFAWAPTCDLDTSD